MMLENYSIIGTAFSVTLVILTLYLFKKRKLSAITFTRWFIIGCAIGVVSLVPAFLAFLPMLLGTQLIMSAVTLTAFILVVLLIFYLDYKINDLNNKLMKLVARISADEYKSRQNKDDNKTQRTTPNYKD